MGAGMGEPGTPCACAEGGGDGHSTGQSGDSFRKGTNEGRLRDLPGAAGGSLEGLMTQEGWREEIQKEMEGGGSV